MKERLKVLIAGGGIGGITAALCLARLGHGISVFEQTPKFAEVGAGIQLSPNCTRVLHHLGLEEALRAAAFLPQGAQFRHWRSGKVITETQLGSEAVRRYGFPYFHIHRGDLLQILLDAAGQVSNIALHADACVTGFSQEGAAVRMHVEGGAHEGDLLIGADGIHSVIRAGLWGADQPRFTGNVAWRALVPVERLPAGLVRPMATAWWGPGKHFVHYFIRRGELVNCVGVVGKGGWEKESWTEPGDLRELKNEFAGWHEDIRRLIDNFDEDSLFKWALYDRKPMRRWSKGNVTLLGDACHPTSPFMAQGAALAVEDGAVLAGCLSRASDLYGGVQCYEDLRRLRTASIQKSSRRYAKVFHLSGITAWARDRVAHSARHRAMRGLYGYNALNAAGR